MTMSHFISSVSLCVVLLLGMMTLATDAKAQDDQSAAIPEPRIEDVESIDAIITAVYDVISGPASEERDWDRFLSLFVPDARLIPTAVTPDGDVSVRALSPQDYAGRAAEFFKQPGGFFEYEIGRKVDQYGNIAHVFSSYASFRENEDEPFMRGINSFQLVRRGDRWAVVSIFWDAERSGNPIPPEYLFESDHE
jgi:hypothetical protein